MRRRLLIGLLTGAALFGPRGADACTCGTRGAPCEEFWKVAAVFVGRVESIEPVTGKAGSRFLSSRKVSFSVVEALRGVDARQVVVRTGSGGGDCGYNFKEGREYLVYAAIGEGTGQLTTGICSRTRPVEDAASDLEYARAILAGAPPLGRISGSVMLRTESFDRIAPRDPVPLADVDLRFEKDGVAVARATTDAYGGFSTNGLGPGKYKIVPELPDTQYAVVYPDPVLLLDERGCAEVHVSAAHNGRVSGRVLDKSGAPVAGLTIDLTTATAVAAPARPPLRAVTGGDGRYEIARVPPGKFVVGINTQADRQRANGPRVFHPGVEPLGRATRVAVEPGARVTLTDLIVPASITFVPIAGVVFQGDGSPAVGARVYLKGPEETDYILSEAVTTDENGRFVLAAVDGRSYRVFAERVRAGGASSQLDSSDQAPVTAAEGLAPLRLVLRRR